MNRFSNLLAAVLFGAFAAGSLAAQDPTYTFTSPNPEAGGQLGLRVSGVPDADGDGRDDLLVGANLEDGGAVDAGRAYLYSGATGTLLHTLTSPNPEAGGQFGIWVSGVADADGDRRGDLLVGALFEDGGVADAGRAYLFSGATGTLLRTLQSPNPETNGGFGRSVFGVPDADGDGGGDLLVGAFDEDGGAAEAGRAYLFSGATGTPLHTLTSPNFEFDGAFGRTVAGVEDMDGDGRGDLLVGAYGEDGGAINAGRAYVFSGASGALLRTLQSPNPEGNGGFGTRSSGVPDADGDGRDDLVVGAWFEDGGAVNAGRAYLFSGATGTLLRTLQSPDPEPTGNFGIAASGVEDVDGDGRGDLLVSTLFEDGGAVDAGRAYLFSGATGALLRTLESPNPDVQGQFGVTVSGVEDADGDGRGDLLIGAFLEDGGAADAGRAYLFASGRGLALTASGSPTTILPGGAVTVTVTVSNSTSAPVTGDLWIVAERGGNAVLTRRIGSGTLPAGATVTRSFDLRAPGATPPGTYTINVNVGRFPNAVVASDAFDVTVTGRALAGAPAAEPFVVGALAGDVFAEDGSAAGAELPPSATALLAPVPNPASGRAAVGYALAALAPVRLAVFDLLGREVAVLVEGIRAAGAHEAAFDVSRLPPGVYVVRLTAGASVQTCRLVVAR